VGEPSEERRDDLDAWLAAFHADSVTMAAAAVLASQGTLREAAYRLHDAGFAPPPGYFSEDELAELSSGPPEEGLRRWVRRERRGTIIRAAGTGDFWRNARLR
jgi:hypothetical protein